MENRKRNNLIYNYIRKASLFNLIFPTIILIAAIILIIYIPFDEIFNPKEIKYISDIEEEYVSGNDYIELNLENAKYTGYDKYSGNKKVGSYYYYILDDKCYIIVVKDSKKRVEPELVDYNIKAKLIQNNGSTKKVIKRIASDIDWSYDGLNSITSYITIDNTAYHDSIYYILGAIIIFAALASISYMIVNIVIFVLPRLHPACINFKRLETGKGKNKNLEHVNYELESRCILDAGNLRMTENYLVAHEKFNIEIIPLNSIVWAFKYSTGHGNSWFRIKIRYTLNILCKHGLRISIPGNTDEVINKVLAYLEDNFPNILIGHTEENKLEAKARRKKSKKAR